MENFKLPVAESRFQWALKEGEVSKFEGSEVIRATFARDRVRLIRGQAERSAGFSVRIALPGKPLGPPMDVQVVTSVNWQ